MSEPVVGRWGPGIREKKLGVVLLVFGAIALFVSLTIGLMAVDAKKLLDLPKFLVLVPLWGTISIVLAVLLLSERVRPFLFMIGALWLALGFLPAVWVEFFA